MTTKSKKNITTSKKKSLPKKSKTNNSISWKTSWINIIRKGETIRFVLGLLLICIAVFLFISFLSFLFNGKADAINIEQLNNHVTLNVSDVNNCGGILGLKAANYFMQNGFGFSAVFIPVILILM